MPKLANAIARKYNLTIVPSENTALNILWLDTQVPTKYTYIPYGRYIKYNINSVIIEFKRRNNSEISKMNKYTTIIIHALKTISKDNVAKKNISL